MKISELVQKYGLAVTATIPPKNIMSNGNVFFVDSGATNTLNAVDGEHGNSWDQPFATIDYAVNQCIANQGDLILVAPGHAETISNATSIVLDVAGVTIIGVGNGNARPTLTFDNTAGLIEITGDSVLVENIEFVASVPEVVKGISIAGVGCSLLNCIFRVDTEGTDEFLSCLFVAGTASYCRIAKCYFSMGGGAANTAILLAGCNDSILEDNIIFGDYEVCVIGTGVSGPSSQAYRMVVRKNILFNGTIGGAVGLNTKPCIGCGATSTGIISDNYVACNVASDDASIVGAFMVLFNNVYSETEGPSTGLITAGG